MPSLITRSLLAVTGLALLIALPATAAPRAVASILPLHSLLAGVMQGVAEPELLIPPGQSPHRIELRPSQAEHLSRAELVVWIGPNLETGLRKPVAVLGSNARVLTLGEDAELAVLPTREGGVWEGHEHGGHEAHHEDPKAEGHPHDAHTDEHHDGVDPHLWLSPSQAAGIVRRLADTLSELDPGHAERYRGNAATMLGRLDALDVRLEQRLAPVREIPYLVFHDAYQYFEQRYRLHAVGAVTIDPEHAPGARRIAELRARIAASGARCVFAEPQFEPRILRTLLDGSTARAGELDPIGAALTPGEDAYFALLDGLADALVGCLTH